MSTQPAAQTPERVLQRLDWEVIRRLDGLLQGDYRGLFRGQGIDFADLREYQPEDDVRHIDWNVTARTDTPHVRQFIEDREVTGWFLLDLSPSMDFGTARAQKRTLLIDFVGTLARLLTRHGNRIGALCYGGAVGSTIPPRGGRLQVLRVTDEILRQPQLPSAPFTDLGALLEAGLRTIKRRSLIFVVSDFISAPGWEATLRRLAQRHEVVAVHLWDPREADLPDLGPIIMQDAETGEQLYVDTRDKGFRKRFREAAQRRDAERTVAFRRAGVDTLTVSTEDDLVRAIARFAMRRRRYRR